MTHCPLFVELCAGTAAVSLQLHRAGAPGVVARRGRKTAYAPVILQALGLYPGQQAERYLWCEPDPGCRLLLHAYTDGSLAVGAAAILRGWQGQHERKLWDALKAEGPVSAPSPRELARWVMLGSFSYRDGDPDSGFSDSFTKDKPPTDTSHGGKARRIDRRAPLLERLSVERMVAAIMTDGRLVRPDRPPRGTVVYIDGPYRGTTPYRDALSREEQVAMALRWWATGALVGVSEAEPVEELVAVGWHPVELTGERKGSARTFSRQQREWLTVSRRPSWQPTVQVSLF